MIFVTVGTHEQQFNRLIEEVDKLKGQGIINEDVFIQTGYSTYEPKHCQWADLIAYDKMNDYIDEARIVITHGGPSSFMEVLRVGKIPIVCPRQKKYGEHVNDHQLDFCRNVDKRMGNIILIETMEELSESIESYHKLSSGIDILSSAGNDNFCQKLEMLIREMFNNA